ncbi:unnamed protein product [Diabrotica balteata]|uniref:Uncharacterized protein n=1 Tax=Diabrotica balteata TaxID=107213 RepID=A0A9N9SVJ1_DIABA|nr:unnamed protein product [Diabrotica balteata]
MQCTSLLKYNKHLARTQTLIIFKKNFLHLVVRRMKLWYSITILLIIQKDSISASHQIPEEYSGSGSGDYIPIDRVEGIGIDDEDYHSHGNKDIYIIDDDDYNSTIDPHGIPKSGDELSKNITSKFSGETYTEYKNEIDKNTSQHTIISNVTKIDILGEQPRMYSIWKKLTIESKVSEIIPDDNTILKEKSELNIDIIKLIQNSNKKCTVYTSIENVNFVIYC